MPHLHNSVGNLITFQTPFVIVKGRRDRLNLTDVSLSRKFITINQGVQESYEHIPIYSLKNKSTTSSFKPQKCQYAFTNFLSL
jgi:hypothetical protein